MREDLRPGLFSICLVVCKILWGKEMHFNTCYVFPYSRMPVGSYTNIECRESPLCSIADENETSKLTYKKSVFKKKSTSSTATVRKQTVSSNEKNKFRNKRVHYSLVWSLHYPYKVGNVD